MTGGRLRFTALGGAAAADTSLCSRNEEKVILSPFMLAACLIISLRQVLLGCEISPFPRWREELKKSYHSGRGISGILPMDMGIRLSKSTAASLTALESQGRWELQISLTGCFQDLIWDIVGMKNQRCMED